MPVLRIPGLMKSYVDNQTEVPLSGASMRAVMDNLAQQYPAIRVHVFDDKGKIRRYINLFVNGENIRSLQGLDTPVSEDDKLVLLPSISGG
jgi:molybdopterin synthase sulfur carrier subunit